MRAIVLIVATAIVVFAASAAHALAVISANGFTCNGQAANNRTLVECDGQFPGITGLFGGTGYDIVHVEYSPDNQRRFFYMSETGCLIMNAADNSALAVDKSGAKKQFPAFMDAMQWCYTGGQAAPAAPPASSPR